MKCDPAAAQHLWPRQRKSGTKCVQTREADNPRLLAALDLQCEQLSLVAQHKINFARSVAPVMQHRRNTAVLKMGGQQLRADVVVLPASLN